MIFILFLLFSIILPISADEPFEPLNEDLTMIIEVSEGRAGDIITIQITGKWNLSISRIYLSLLYDETKVQYYDFTRGNLFENWLLSGSVQIPGGRLISISAHDKGLSVPAGKGTLMEIEFRILEEAVPGSTYVNFTDYGLSTAYYPYYDSYNDSLIPELYNGTINIITNNPPSTPEQPQGPNEGFVDVEYSFSTNPVIDPDGDNVFYKFSWGDETESSWIIEPVVSKSWTAEGTYEIKTKAKDVYSEESDWSEPLEVTITFPLPALFIGCPSSIVEEEDFDIAITSDGAPIENVSIEFNSEEKTTDASGKVTFTAPEVTANKDYTITATLGGYTEDTKVITVLNQVEQRGWIYGVASNTFGSLIENATICARISGEEIINKCTFTDEKGRYIVSVIAGKYAIEASKEGYGTSTKSCEVEENVAIELNFILQEEIIIDNKTESSFQDELIDYLIESEEEVIKINFDSINNDYDILLFTEDELNIIVDTQEQELSLTVSASNETPGKLFILRINDASMLFNSIQDINKLVLKFDGIEIEKEYLSNVIGPKNENVPKWTGLLIEDTLVALIWVPKFSTHTITISSFVETISSIIIATLYIIFAVIATIFILGPSIKKLMHINAYLKKKR